MPGSTKQSERKRLRQLYSLDVIHVFDLRLWRYEIVTLLGINSGKRTHFLIGQMQALLFYILSFVKMLHYSQLYCGGKESK